MLHYTVTFILMGKNGPIKNMSFYSLIKKSAILICFINLKNTYRNTVIVHNWYKCEVSTLNCMSVTGQNKRISTTNIETIFFQKLTGRIQWYLAIQCKNIWSVTYLNIRGLVSIVITQWHSITYLTYTCQWQ
jgi:hypothetical protein